MFKTQVEESVEIVALEGSTVGADPNEVAEIVRSCCRAPEGLTSKWGVLSVTIEKTRITARVRLMRVPRNSPFFMEDESPHESALEEITNWFRNRVELGRLAFAEISRGSDREKTAEDRLKAKSATLEEVKNALLDKMIEVGDLTVKLAEAEERVKQLEALKGLDPEPAVPEPF